MHPYTKLLSHVLNVEFPELADTFAKMAQENGHFAKLMAQYSALDQQITDDEENVKILEDDALSRLKHQRAAIKDELYQVAKAAHDAA